jgi:hypothetical protein
MARRQVTTSREHIQSLSKATPLQGVEELIWNGLDAGGVAVEVRLALGPLRSLETIEVIDHGTGIPLDQIDEAFGQIGNSQKVRQKVTAEGRLLHGSEGRGRFKALSLCRQPEWITIYRKNGKLRRYSIRINQDDPDYFDVSPEEELASGRTGTVVRLAHVDEGSDSLLKDGTREILTRRFALYLSEYPDLSVTFDDQALRVDELIDLKQDYPLPVAESEPSASVTVIEWRFKLDSRKLYLCNESGFAFHDVPLRLHAPGIDYTAYLRTPKVKEWAEAGLFATAEMDESVQRLLEVARDQVRAHLRQRLSLAAQDVVAEWKRENVYPYREEENRDSILAAEQEVFNIVAVQIDSLHPTFRDSDLDNKRLTLRLIRQALESNPAALMPLLRGFTELTEQEQQDLAELLQRTTFSRLIRAGSIVTQRLDTIQALEHILYSDDWRPRLLERTQLHRLLMHELWILGEEFQVATDDESLREVLAKHLEILGRSDPAPEADVKLITGKDGIPDLMLWHRGRVDRSMFEHLVVELKRPSGPLGQKEVGQIENYAFSVAGDERFKTDKVRWKFVLLGNDLHAYAIERATSDRYPPGCIHSKGNVSIWVLRWADVLADARIRYEFFRERLDVQASREKGMERFKTRYQHLFTGRGVRKKKDLEVVAAKREEGNAGSTGEA